MENRVGGLAFFTISPVLFLGPSEEAFCFHQWKNGRTNVFLLKNLEELWLDIKWNGIGKTPKNCDPLPKVSPAGCSSSTGVPAQAQKIPGLGLLVKPPSQFRRSRRSGSDRRTGACRARWKPDGPNVYRRPERRVAIQRALPIWFRESTQLPSGG